MPADIMPVKRISNHSICIFFKLGCSNIKAIINDNKKTIKYCTAPNIKGLFSYFIKINTVIEEYISHFLKNMNER